MFGSPALKRMLPLLVLVVAGFALPGNVPEYYLYLGNVLMVWAVLAIGLDLLLGWAGQFAFAHTAFFGIGCYTTAVLQIRYGVPFVVGMPVGAVLAGLVGVLVALPSTRMKSVYLALATFAFAEGAYWVFHSWVAVTNGPDGLRLPPADVLGFAMGTDRKAFPVLAVMLALVVAATMYLLSSKLGRNLVAIRESEHVAMASGIDVRMTKVIAFVLSAIYAAVAGSMFTLHQSYVNPEQFGFVTIVLVLSMIVVGGMGTLPGVLIGVVILGLLPELLRTVLRNLQVWQELVYGSILMLTMMFMPRGIWGAVKSLLQRGKK
jgi:branched-chain amino acid transport system permease protein